MLNKSFFVFTLLLACYANAQDHSCSGKISSVSQHSTDPGKILFKLEGQNRGIKTATNEQSSMILSAFHANKTVTATWDCDLPTDNCTDHNSFTICGTIEVLK